MTARFIPWVPLTACQPVPAPIGPPSHWLTSSQWHPEAHVSERGRRRNRTARTRNAYTLLEVTLALALSSLLLGIIYFGLDVYWRAVDRSEHHVREAQVARTVMNLIARDLENVVVSSAEEIDSEAVPELDPELAAILGIETDETTEEASGDEGTSSADTSLIPQTLGIYGEANWLQVDTLSVSRVPMNSEEDMAAYDGSAMGATATQSSAGGSAVFRVMTVAYYMSEEVVQESTAEDEQNTVNGQTLIDSLFEPGGPGLYRRELDRAVTLYAQELGTIEDYETNLVPLASEVEAIEFAYFDGEEWLEEWDSEESGGLPPAIRITVALRQSDSSAGRLGPTWFSREEVEPEPLLYSLMVRLPEAGVIAPTTEEDAAIEETAGMEGGA